MSLRMELSDYFIDPISHKMMTNPCIANCGHVFEEKQVKAWKSTQCPLHDHPLGNLISEVAAIRPALEILNNPANEKAKKITDLTGEEQEVLNSVIASIKKRREEDRQKGIPDRLPNPNDLQQIAFRMKEQCKEWC